MSEIIEVQGLKKHYGPIEAVLGIDFSVRRGELFAFLGQNGAGKSTTISMLTTQIAPDGGRAQVDGCLLGRENGAIRRKIGVVFQESLLDDLLSVEENLLARAALYGLRGERGREAARAAMAAVGALDLRGRRYGRLSGGQRRRADIARALVHRPEILFLDEPTTGLDPQTRKAVWETVRALQREGGMTVFLTTHYMEEAAQADAVTVIGDGAVLEQGTPGELKARYGRDKLYLSPRDADALEGVLRQMGLAYTKPRRRYHLALGSTLEAIPILERCRDLLDGAELIGGTMDDVFLQIIEGGERPC